MNTILRYAIPPEEAEWRFPETCAEIDLERLTREERITQEFDACRGLRE